MASSIYDWSTDPASNATADEDINWAEGMPPSGVNNSARQMMGRVAEYIKDIGGILESSGTANSITLTANSAITTYTNGLRFTFRAGATNNGAATLNVNNLDRKSTRLNSSHVKISYAVFCLKKQDTASSQGHT